MTDLSRRDLLRGLAAAAVAAGLPAPLAAQDEDRRRLREWSRVLRDEGLAQRGVPLGRAAVRVGELAAGSPYEPFMLEAYLKAGGSPRKREPLALSLTRFDCVTLVEGCLAVARVARATGGPSWDPIARGVGRVRDSGAKRSGDAARRQ